jgi:hypothetical protein
MGDTRAKKRNSVKQRQKWLRRKEKSHKNKNKENRSVTGMK